MEVFINYLISFSVVVFLIFIFRKNIIYRIVGQMIRPTMKFEDFTPPPKPDYKKLNSWAAHPNLDDGAEMLTPKNEMMKTSKNAAVFYIHPTGYFGKTWNASIDKDTPHFERTEGMLAGQASAFNSSCDIYAPEYRQATFFSFYDETGDGQKALARAYQDIESAFFEFLNMIDNKPFFIAAHSQGTLHAQQLISKHLDGNEVSKRMIAAYLIGYPILRDDLDKLFKNLEICQSPDQLNCLIAWCSVDENTRLDGESWSWDPSGWKRCKRDEYLFGTNPISWSTKSEWVSTENKNKVLDIEIWDQSIKGLTRKDRTDKSISISLFNDADFHVRLSEKGLAEVRGKFLKRFDSVEFGLGNLHVVDYSLFWGSIRDNAELRLSKYLDQKH